MPRPTFALTDEQGRQIVAGLNDIEQTVPVNARDHRPFVREFIRLVHRATGKTFSPAIYRRLLSAYAPQRRPSTSTLALEKEQFVQSLDVGVSDRPTVATDESSGSAIGPDLALLITTAVSRAVALAAPRVNPAAENYLVAQCQFLQGRVTDLEQQLVDARANAARLIAAQAADAKEAEQGRGELARLRAHLDQLTGQIGAMAQVLEDARRFSLQAIDEARGESRALRERCQHAEQQLREQVMHTETFRRLAYQKGAAIPPALTKP